MSTDDRAALRHERVLERNNRHDDGVKRRYLIHGFLDMVEGHQFRTVCAVWGVFTRPVRQGKRNGSYKISIMVYKYRHGSMDIMDNIQ
jgi:hypothetical protein